jgi:hypothetical protein
MNNHHRIVKTIGLLALVGGLAACSANSGVSGGGGDDDGDTGIPGLRCVDAFLASNGATVDSDVSLNCIGCEVSNTDRAIDGMVTTFANISVPLSLLGGTANLTVISEPGMSSPGGTTTGFIVRSPDGSPLSANLISTLTVSTLLNDVVQEADADFTLLDLGLVGGQGGLNAVLIDTTEAFDAIRLELFALVGAGLSLDVGGACRAFVIEDDETP